jgi:hypothetical protein
MHKYATAIFVLTISILSSSCEKGVAAAPASATIDANKYYAVVLNNGTLYFGHLEGLGTPFPVLHDVYYVQSSQNNDTKAVSSVLVKRGKEWHGPDRMILNAASIVCVEPVGSDSKVAQLISESKKQ